MPLKTKPQVMIVDDNIVNLQVARKALNSIYTIIPVTSGQEALTLLEKSLPSSFYYCRIPCCLYTNQHPRSFLSKTIKSLIHQLL